MNTRIVSLSSHVDCEQLDLGCHLLSQHGFTVSCPESVRSTHFLFAGTEKERWQQLESALNDPCVDVIWCARGGTGANALLPYVSEWLLNHRPKAKVFVGLSDVTPLMNMLMPYMAIIYGPMIATTDFATLSAKHWTWFQSLMMRNNTCLSEIPYRFLQGTQMKGKIIGGTLAMLISVLGTPYDCIYDGRILFIEDVNEPSYRVWRHLNQLLQSGKLDRLKGLIVGSFSERDQDKTTLVSVEKELAMVCQNMSYPIIVDFPLGHMPNSIALPFGMPITLTRDGQIQTLW